MGAGNSAKGAYGVDASEVVHEGYLLKKGGWRRTGGDRRQLLARRRNWKKRYFVLLSSKLLYFKTAADVTGRPMGVLSFNSTSDVCTWEDFNALEHIKPSRSVSMSRTSDSQRSRSRSASERRAPSARSRDESFNTSTATMSHPNLATSTSRLASKIEGTAHAQPPRARYDHMFVVAGFEGNLVVRAEMEEDADRWMEKIFRCISKTSHEERNSFQNLLLSFHQWESKIGLLDSPEQSSPASSTAIESRSDSMATVMHPLDLSMQAKGPNLGVIREEGSVGGLSTRDSVTRGSVTRGSVSVRREANHGALLISTEKLLEELTSLKSEGSHIAGGKWQAFLIFSHRCFMRSHDLAKMLVTKIKTPPERFREHLGRFQREVISLLEIWHKEFPEDFGDISKRVFDGVTRHLDKVALIKWQGIRGVLSCSSSNSVPHLEISAAGGGGTNANKLMAMISPGAIRRQRESLGKRGGSRMGKTRPPPPPPPRPPRSPRKAAEGRIPPPPPPRPRSKTTQPSSRTPDEKKAGAAADPKRRVSDNTRERRADMKHRKSHHKSGKANLTLNEIKIGTFFKKFRPDMLNATGFDEKAVVTQMLHVDMEFIRRINPRSFLQKRWKSKDAAFVCPDLVHAIGVWNKRCYWIASVILRKDGARAGGAVGDWVTRVRDGLKRFISIGAMSIEKGNYFAASCILCALRMQCVRRLRAAWDALPRDSKKNFAKIEDACARKNYWVEFYRQTEEEDVHIPNLAVVLDSLYQLEVKCAKDTETEINLTKYKKQWDIIFGILTTQRQATIEEEKDKEIMDALTACVHWALSEDKLYEISYKYVPRGGRVSSMSSVASSSSVT